jgi:DtxR family transcriptional regulator, Mn-dependent transcriptional regulator
MVNNQADRSRQRAHEDYVKGIYQLAGNAPVRAVDLARYLHVSRPSVTKSRRSLESSGLIQTSKGRTDRIALTTRGAALAVRIVRRHRLIETFLHQVLKVPLERVHGDAERIEHTISDDIAERLCRFLGNPTSDPHGHPIPSPAAKRAPKGATCLADTSAGDAVIVTSLDDRDEAAVKYLSEHSILPGVMARIERNARGAIRVRVGRSSFTISKNAAAHVWCTLQRGVAR